MKRKMFISGAMCMFGIMLVLGFGKTEIENPTETVMETETAEETGESGIILEETEPEIERPLTEEELLAIDGGDAEYWKWYDAAGNPIERIEESDQEESTADQTEPQPENMTDDELLEYLDGGDVDSVPMSNALENLDFYRNIADEISAIEIYDSSELTEEILCNCNGEIIVEKCIGIVLDDEGNGRQLNPSVEGQDYIRYHDIPAGSVVLSVFVYNPYTNATDDIAIRQDFILDSAE